MKNAQNNHIMSVRSDRDGSHPLRQSPLNFDRPSLFLYYDLSGLGPHDRFRIGIVLHGVVVDRGFQLGNTGKSVLNLGLEAKGSLNLTQARLKELEQWFWTWGSCRRIR